jgi:hypothetical protein
LKIKLFNFLHTFIPWNFAFIQLIFIKWRCFQRFQTLTYILTKNKQIFLKIFTHHMVHYVIQHDCNIILLLSHQYWVMHINLCKTIPIRSPSLSYAHWCGQKLSSWIIICESCTQLKLWLIGDDSPNHFQTIKRNHQIKYQT